MLLVLAGCGNGGGGGSGAAVSPAVWHARVAPQEGRLSAAVGESNRVLREAGAPSVRVAALKGAAVPVADAAEGLVAAIDAAGSPPAGLVTAVGEYRRDTRGLAEAARAWSRCTGDCGVEARVYDGALASFATSARLVAAG